MKIHAIAALLSIGAGFLPLSAQAKPERSPFEAQFTANIATADAKKMSSGSHPAGYTVSLAMRHELHPGLSTRVHLGLMSFAGREGSGLENRKRLHPHAGFDLVKEYQSLSLFGGLTATQLRQAVVTSHPDFSGANRGEGVKLGLRLGAEVAIGRGFGALVTFSQSEFNRKFNPSWVSAGIVYRFRGA